MRLTALYWLRPRSFIESYPWERYEVDFEEWSRFTYTWKQDDWNGMKDTVQPVTETLVTESGDCDDYSLVATSYLDKTTDHDIFVVALYSYRPLAGHMITYDETEQTVYSSGRILDQTLDEYVEQSKYDIALDRKV